MKKVLFLLIVALAFLASCSKDSDSVKLTVSNDELFFSPEEGEQTVVVTSDAYWDCECHADWLIVRQLENKIKIIVEANTDTEARSAVVKVIVNGSVQCEITVTQAGMEIIADSYSFKASSKGETITVPVQSNVQWSVENDNDWCTAQRNNDQLNIIIDRNYEMTDRSGEIFLKHGNVTYAITITQQGCEWFESFEMVDVETGTFYMGAQHNDVNSINYDASSYQIESPVHSVTIDAYSIGKFEVTQLQWMLAMGSNPSVIQGDNLPVENVTWEDVQEFIALLNEKSGLNYRLPTEAEWEYAARGGNKSNGFKYSGSSVLGACAWYYSNSNATTHEVGTRDANELGIFDMSGNVREWCNDWFSYYGSSSTTNPQGGESGTIKVNRGGSWTTPAVNCRNTYRHSDSPNEAAQDLGFRLVLSR